MPVAINDPRDRWMVVILFFLLRRVNGVKVISAQPVPSHSKHTTAVPFGSANPT